MLGELEHEPAGGRRQPVELDRGELVVPVDRLGHGLTVERKALLRIRDLPQNVLPV
jgi:hypothetical protein